MQEFSAIPYGAWFKDQSSEVQQTLCDRTQTVINLGIDAFEKRVRKDYGFDRPILYRLRRDCEGLSEIKYDIENVGHYRVICYLTPDNEYLITIAGLFKEWGTCPEYDCVEWKKIRDTLLSQVYKKEE